MLLMPKVDQETVSCLTSLASITQLDCILTNLGCLLIIFTIYKFHLFILLSIIHPIMLNTQNIQHMLIAVITVYCAIVCLQNDVFVSKLISPRTTLNFRIF